MLSSPLASGRFDSSRYLEEGPSFFQYPNGILSQSLGLPGTGYPRASHTKTNPEGVASRNTAKPLNPKHRVHVPSDNTSDSITSPRRKQAFRFYKDLFSLASSSKTALAIANPKVPMMGVEVP